MKAALLLAILAQAAQAQEPEVSQETADAEALCPEANTAELIVVSLKKHRQIRAGCGWLKLLVEEAQAGGGAESCDAEQLRFLNAARKICRKHGG